MTPAEVEALCLRLETGGPFRWQDAAAALRQLVRERDEAIEECAKVAEQQYADEFWHMLYRQAGRTIAAAIRARKEQDNG